MHKTRNTPPKGKHPGYFEAILQLRDIPMEIMDFVEDEIATKKVYVSKIVEYKNGIDYYLAENNFGKQLGKKLQQKFGGKVQITASLHTRKKDREVYRLTILFRAASFTRGDLVDYKGEKYNVKAMGKEIILQNNNTGKKVHLNYKHLDKVQKVNDQE